MDEIPKWHKDLAPYFADGWPAFISCADGWRDIILNLVRDLDILGIPWKFHQVKEKFGSLRIYAYIHSVDDQWLKSVSAPDHELSAHDQKILAFNSKSSEEKAVLFSEFDALISKACMMSDTTCEYCGKYGKRRDDAYVVTLCDDCYDRDEE